MKKTTGTLVTAWFLFGALMAPAIKLFGAFVTGNGFDGPLGWIVGIISFLVILVLLFGIETVKAAPKEFGHYFLFGEITGISISPGVYPTFGNIMSIKHFPGDQDLVVIPVTVTCASAAGAGKGPDVTVTFNLEAALDPNEVKEIVSLGSVDSPDLTKFRDELKKFVVSKVEEHAKNGILGMELDVLNADRFALIQKIVEAMWTNGQAPQGQAAIHAAFRAGTPNLIQGLLVSALRVNSVSEPGEIKAQRTKTQVALAQVETARADFAVARIREDQNKMEAARYAEILADLVAKGIPKEQLALIAAAITDKVKVTGNVTVLSTDGSPGGRGVAQSMAQGQGLGQGLAAAQNNGGNNP